MSCYFRHLNDLFAEAGVEVTKENRKAIDAAIHKAAGIVYKDCPSTGRAVKELLATPRGRARLIAAIKRAS